MNDYIIQNNKYTLGLEIIPENAEENPIPIYQKKDNKIERDLNTADTVSTKISKKEQERNPYYILLELSDLIEVDPEIEFSLREIENIMLRNNSEIKFWYKTYVNKEFSNIEKTERSKLSKEKSHDSQARLSRKDLQKDFLKNNTADPSQISDGINMIALLG